ncbi:MAG: 4-hydroxybutyrate dehydrogenase [Spirochaetaceae bacterium]|jgi:4-hydroxybutyrate dehydrogenase|nr:4-hydroxybutyrate dehydrogenase [Spirochaetaceae bacterium]
MKELTVRPDIYRFEQCEDFAAQFALGKDDLIITNEYIFEPYFGSLHLPSQIIHLEKYGTGEPTDDMVEALYRDITRPYTRVVAIGGGTVLDVGKVFSLKNIHPVLKLYDNMDNLEREKKLVLVPTTCGTGSEVTNIAILSLVSLGTKKGLAVDCLYADQAVLIPRLLEKLPFKVFAASSIDALIHSVESSLSPKRNGTTLLFGYRAIEIILNGYREIAKNGPDARFSLLPEFLRASNYAGIAFGNAGCAAVHALSYPLGAAYRVPHGESNYAVFIGVMKNYMELKRDGPIDRLNTYMAALLGCKKTAVYGELEKLLSHLIERKPLSAYGVTRDEIVTFTDSVLANQQRLLANNFVPLDRDRILKIYRELY